MDITKQRAYVNEADQGHVIKQGQGENKLDSRKFVITLAGLFLLTACIVFGAYSGLVTKDNFSGLVTAITGIVGGYVIGQGYADGQAAKKPNTK
jgi:hypothetical protein